LAISLDRKRDRAEGRPRLFVKVRTEDTIARRGQKAISKSGVTRTTFAWLPEQHTFYSTKKAPV